MPISSIYKPSPNHATCQMRHTAFSNSVLTTTPSSKQHQTQPHKIKYLLNTTMRNPKQLCHHFSIYTSTQTFTMRNIPKKKMSPSSHLSTINQIKHKFSTNKHLIKTKRIRCSDRTKVMQRKIDIKFSKKKNKINK